MSWKVAEPRVTCLLDCYLTAC